MTIASSVPIDATAQGEALRAGDVGRQSLLATDAVPDDDGLTRPDDLLGDYWFDEDVLEAQATTPAGARVRAQPSLLRFRSRTRRSQRIARAGVSLGLASVPFMIGDSGVGTCFSIRGITTADISHPTLTCARLNISENNSALPTDRFYYSYRHYANSTHLQVFQYAEAFDLDVHTFGGERTFWDGLGSVEIRVPVERRLRSDLISLIAPTFNVVDVVTGSDDYEAGIGNVSILTKLLLTESGNFVLSGGLGVTVPTARDVSYDIGVQDTIIFPIAPGVTGDTFAIFENDFINETVYLSPYLAWLWRPEDKKSRWHHQGFLQVEVAANPSTLITNGSGFTDFFFGGSQIGDVVFQTPGLAPVAVDVFAQTLLRLNLGVGYQLTDADSGGLISNIRSLFEMHYTTTVQRSNLTDIPLEQAGSGAFFTQFGTVGNANPRADILNAAAGVSMDIGPLAITHGFIAPLRGATDRGFDFEYNLQVQLPY